MERRFGNSVTVFAAWVSRCVVLFTLVAFPSSWCVPDASSRGQCAPAQDSMKLCCLNSGNWFLQSDSCRFPVVVSNTTSSRFHLTVLLSSRFKRSTHFGPLPSVGADIITLDVDVVSWRVPTSSDGCAVLWFLLNNPALAPLLTNCFAEFSFYRHSAAALSKSWRRSLKMSVAGLKKQFYKASQVCKTFPPC